MEGGVRKKTAFTVSVARMFCLRHRSSSSAHKIRFHTFFFLLSFPISHLTLPPRTVSMRGGEEAAMESVC